MSKFYHEATIPAELRRNFDVYDRIKELGIELGTWEENVTSLAGAGISSAVFTASGLVYLSGVGKGQLSMINDEAVIQHGQEAGKEAADQHIRLLHWAITCGSEGGDLNDVLYTVKALGMVVSPGAGSFHVSTRSGNTCSNSCAINPRSPLMFLPLPSFQSNLRGFSAMIASRPTSRSLTFSLYR